MGTVRKLPGLNAVNLSTKASRAKRSVHQQVLAREAELSAFIDGALAANRRKIPHILRDHPELMRAFRRGQLLQRNIYGRVIHGEWVWHDTPMEGSSHNHNVEGY